MKMIHLGALAAAAFTFLAAQPAEARRYRHHHHAIFANTIVCDSLCYRPSEIHVHVLTIRRHQAMREHVPRERRERAIDANGNRGFAVIRSGKTGETATVRADARAAFQGFLDDLEAHGATVYYMGGWRRGHCSLGSQHPCGLAVDFCQDYYGHVSGLKDCHLPRPAEFHELVRAHGLYDGSVWCHSDYGHVQVKESGGCRVAPHGSWGHGRVRLATMTGKMIEVRHRPQHHRRYHFARR